MADKLVDLIGIGNLLESLVAEDIITCEEILVVDKYDLGHIRNGSSNLLKILYEKHLSLVTDIDYQKYIQSHEAESLLNN